MPALDKCCRSSPLTSPDVPSTCLCGLEPRPTPRVGTYPTCLRGGSSWGRSSAGERRRRDGRGGAGVGQARTRYGQRAPCRRSGFNEVQASPRTSAFAPHHAARGEKGKNPPPGPSLLRDPQISVAVTDVGMRQLHHWSALRTTTIPVTPYRAVPRRHLCHNQLTGDPTLRLLSLQPPCRACSTASSHPLSIRPLTT